MNTRTVRRPSYLTKDQPTRRHRPDYWLLIFSVFLLVVGLVVVYAISPGLSVQKNVSENYFITKQLVAIALGVATFIVASMVPTKSWQRARMPLIVLSILASIAVMVFGERVNGAYRWIQVGGLSFQAVELIKFTLLIWLAGFLTDRIKSQELTNAKKTFQPLLILLAIIAIVVANPKVQSDLGSTGVLIAMIAAMCFVACLPLKKVLIIGLVVVAGTGLLIITSPYRRDRFQTFLQPQRDCQNTGYQACQALIAIGSGGMFGKGLAHSVQAYGYLPEAANDSIFAIYAEKFGFVGVTLLLCLYAAFYTRLKSIMERAPDIYSRLLVVGVMAWLSTQAVINIGAMIGLLPLKGITLPFISYGGTSIIFVTAAIGIVFNISRYTTYGVNANLESEEGSSNENIADRRRDRRTYNAYPSRRA